MCLLVYVCMGVPDRGGSSPGTFLVYRGTADWTKLRVRINMERPGYYVYYSSTSSFSPKERKALYDLYGRDFFTKGS